MWNKCKYDVENIVYPVISRRKTVFIVYVEINHIRHQILYTISSNLVTKPKSLAFSILICIEI